MDIYVKFGARGASADETRGDGMIAHQGACVYVFIWNIPAVDKKLPFVQGPAQDGVNFGV